MNVKWRLALRIIFPLLVVGALLFLMAVGVTYWIIRSVNAIEAERDFQTAGLQEIVETITRDKDRLKFNPKLLKMVHDQGGWLQRIDADGKVTDSFYAPPDVPTSYGPGELTGYWLGTTPFPYHILLWIKKKDGLTHTLIYGTKDRDDQQIRQIMSASAWDGRQLRLPDSVKEELVRTGAWLQLLDGKGGALASFNSPSGLPAAYSVQDFALRSVYKDLYGARLSSRYDEKTGLTWALGTPLTDSKPGVQRRIQPEVAVLLEGVGTLLLLSLAVFAAVSLWFGHRFGGPLIHILGWLRQLDGARYAEPADRSGRPRSLGRTGKRKRKYSGFGEVLDSLASLSDTLRRGESLREETDRLREEWTAGVSHDLKTPLSSIKGYAHLLEEKSYEWSQEEIREFGGIIREKAAFMEDLIQDLSLVQRLRSGEARPALAPVELNECLEEVVRTAALSPQFGPGRIRFVPAACPIVLQLNDLWFRRIADNLIANALLHNAPPASVTVSLAAEEDGSVVVSFQDDGAGMDEETVERLFERYYRGTNTEMAAGGTGLGMTVTKALTDALGGRIEVESGLGHGTTIRLRWPARQQSEESLPEK